MPIRYCRDRDRPSQWPRHSGWLRTSRRPLRSISPWAGIRYIWRARWHDVVHSHAERPSGSYRPAAPNWHFVTLCYGRHPCQEFINCWGRRLAESRDMRVERMMEEQPMPRDDRWPWSTVLWPFPCTRATTIGSVRVSYGIREYCTQCGEMIFADKIACVVTVEHGRRWLTLHFHRACYVAWERMARHPPPVADKVVAPSKLSARRDEPDCGSDPAQ